MFTVKDGNFETVTTADHYAAHHYPGNDNVDAIYLHDGEEVSKVKIGQAKCREILEVLLA